VSHLRLPQLGGPGPHIYITQEQGGPVILLGTGFPFVASYDSQGYGGGILIRLHTGEKRISFIPLKSFCRIVTKHDNGPTGSRKLAEDQILRKFMNSTDLGPK
jgi:hypothetical protein